MRYKIYEDEMFLRLENASNLKKQDPKYDYIIVKPNGASHLKVCLNALEWRGFSILGIYAISDFEKVNMALHTLESEREKIIPINKMFLDYFGNYAVCIVISKDNITYEKFADMVNGFKWFIRGMTATPYVTCVFNQCEFMNKAENQVLQVVDTSGNSVPMYEMNNKGSFIVTMPNSIHTPDAIIQSIVTEFTILKELGIISSKNLVSDEYISKIHKYRTMNVLQDLF